jgi:hypothetical protein
MYSQGSQRSFPLKGGKKFQKGGKRGQFEIQKGAKKGALEKQHFIQKKQ